MQMPLRRWVLSLALGLPAMTVGQEAAGPQFGWSPHVWDLLPADLGDAGAQVRSTRTGLDVGGLWVLTERWRLGLETGLEYAHYKITDFPAMLPDVSTPMKDLFTMRFAPSVIYGLNQKWSLVGGTTVALNGDAEAIVADTLTIGGYAGARRQLNERFAFTFGIYGATRLEEDVRLLPLLGVEWQISKRWRLATQGTSGQINYTITKPLSAFFRLAFDSYEYRFDPDSSIPEGVLRDTSVPVSLGLEWHPSLTSAVILQAGENFSRTLEFTDRHGKTLAEGDAAGSMFVSLAVKVGFQRQKQSPAVDVEDDLISEGCGREGSVLQVWEENDTFTGTDHAYTQGIRITWLGTEHSPFGAPGWLRWFADGLPALGYDVDRARGGVTLGQNIYTPDPIDIKELQPDDRPYAGWLYGSPILQRRGVTTGGVPVLEEARLDLGWIGPGALAGEAQNLIHRLRNISEAQGWENQLHNEPTASLTYARAWRLPIGGDRDTGAVECIPHFALTGGTPRTLAAAGGTLRIGVRLPDDFGQPTIRSTLPSTGSGRPGGFGVHMFAGIEGRALAHDSIVDGNLWRESHSQESEPLGLEGRLGFAATWRRVDLGFTYTYESRDFEGQPHNHGYGSLWLNWRL